jgi:hypothetical protein
MVPRSLALAATFLLSLAGAGCAIPPLANEGRSCSLDDPCEAGLFCDPTTWTCQKAADASVDIDTPADLPQTDQDGAADSELPESDAPAPDGPVADRSPAEGPVPPPDQGEDATCMDCLTLFDTQCCPTGKGVCQCLDVGNGCQRWVEIDLCGPQEACVNAACCPSAQICAGICCGAQETCVSGTCCPVGQACGTSCCAAQETCVGGSCCPAGKECGTTCCASSEMCHTGLLLTCAVPATGATALYLTQNTHSGNLGGRSGADATCAAEKPAALLCSTPHAFLSVGAVSGSAICGSTADEIQDMPVNYGFDPAQQLYFYHSVDHQLRQFATDWGDALDGTINVTVADGTGGSFGSWDAFWTGSTNSGAVDQNCQGTDPALHWNYSCMGWSTTSSSNALAGIGHAQKTTYWIESSNNYMQCTNQFRFLCACQL